MISYKLTDEELGGMVDNIIRVWDSATVEQLTRGRLWYQSANDSATFMAEGDTRRGAGVIAALSPMNAWEVNVRQAAEAIDAGNAAGLHTGDAIRKAERIMAGEDPLKVLPPDSKTWNFYRCIVDPTDADAVAIDRHAHDIAVGRRFNGEDRGLSSKKRYAVIALAYRLAARKLDQIPSVVQATTWVVWRPQES